MTESRRSLPSRRAARVSSAALGLSGVAIALDPRGTANVLGLSARSARGVAETRIGMGGTFAALGTWALARGTRDAYTAVGVTWLGAAGVRLLALKVDDPRTDVTYWAFLVGEIACGVAGILAAGLPAAGNAELH